MTRGSRLIDLIPNDKLQSVRKKARAICQLSTIGHDLAHAPRLRKVFWPLASERKVLVNH